MNVVVKKASLVSGIFLKYGYELSDNGKKDTINISSDCAVHDDLKNAFRNLIPFFAHICEEITDEELIKKAIKSPEDFLERLEPDPEDKLYPFLKYNVYGFSLGKGSESVIILGSKRLKTYEYISLETPTIRLDNDYMFLSELQESIDVLKSEVLAYMDGKQAPKVEVNGLFGGDGDEDESFD